ncbi:MAG: DUF6114 domain-containing protein [Thermoplasmata archaeon]
MYEVRIYTPPILASLLTLAAGLFILLGGLFLALLNVAFLWVGVTQHTEFIEIGPALGLLMFGAAALMWVLPRGRVAWGALVLVLAVLSIPFALAGFLLGFLLALAGGILAIRHPPTIVSVAPSLPPPPSPPFPV